MLRATLKSLLSRKVRLVLSGLAVVLGVMFVSGSFVLTATLKGSFDSLFTNAYSGIDVAVTPVAKTAAEQQGKAVPTLPTSTVAAVRDVPGVAGVTGEVMRDGARIIGSNGKVVTTMGAPRFGANWTGESTFRQLRTGRGPTADDEVAVNAAVADAAGVHVGDHVQVLTLAPQAQTFTLVGIYGYAGNKDSMSGAHEISFTTAAAQHLLLDQADRFTSLHVDAARGVSETRLRDAVRTALGADYTVQTGKELRDKATKSYSASLGFFNKVLLGFAAVALLVGTFLILNTFSIIVAQRTRELALLRAVGASRRQVIGSVMVEATVIGVIASALGLAAGIGVGSLLGWIFGRMTDLSTDGIRIPVTAVISSFAVGVPITLIAAVLPAVRASRIAPVAAMREASTNDAPLTKLTVSGALLTALGGALLGFGLRADGDRALLMVGGGGFAILIGVALLTPLLARPVAGAIGRLLAWSAPGRLGRLNARRNPRRTAITAAALMVGLALITGMSVILSSVDGTIRHQAATDLKVDLYIAGDDSGDDMPVTFDTSVLTGTAAIDGVRTVVGEYDEPTVVTLPDQVTDNYLVGAYTSVDDMVRLASMRAASGRLSQLGPDDVLLDQQTADRVHLKVGDTVTMQFSNGAPHRMTLVGIYKVGAFVGGFMTGTAHLADHYSQQPNLGLIQVADGASVTGVRKAVDRLLANSPEVTVNTMASLLDQVTSSLKQVLTMVQILLGLAVLIAALGIINTLALSIIERTRELGMLRAIGLRRNQLMRMVTVESIIMSVFGALLGLAVGSGMGITVVRALKDDGITTLALPWGQLASYLLIAALLGVVAAAIPAIRAARVNILAAIAHE